MHVEEKRQYNSNAPIYNASISGRGYKKVKTIAYHGDDAEEMKGQVDLRHDEVCGAAARVHNQGDHDLCYGSMLSALWWYDNVRLWMPRHVGMQMGKLGPSLCHGAQME